MSYWKCEQYSFIEYGNIFTVQEKPSGLIMRSHTLQKGQSITDTIRRSSCQLGRVQQRIDRDDLLE